MVLFTPGTPAPGRQLGAGPGWPRVLVIDRTPLFLDAMRSLFCFGWPDAAVELSTTSEAASWSDRQSRPDLVLCDVLAEPADGHTVAHTLRALDPPVPVILLGDLDEIRPAMSSLIEGAAGLFTKDADPEDLLAGVAAVLAGHKAVGDGVLAAMLAPASPSIPGARPSLIDQLSPTEREVLVLIAQALTVSAIAASRGVSQKTVRNHLASIYRKLAVRNRTEAMLLAARLGLALPDGATAAAS